LLFERNWAKDYKDTAKIPTVGNNYAIDASFPTTTTMETAYAKKIPFGRVWTNVTDIEL